MSFVNFAIYEAEKLHTAITQGAAVPYAIAIILAVGVVPSLLNYTVFYQDKRDLTLSFATLSVPALLLIVLSMLGGEYMTEAVRYLFSILIALVTCTLWLKLLLSSCRTNNSFFKGMLVFPAKIIMSLIWIFLLFGSMLSDTRRSRRTFAFMMALFMPLLYLLINGKQASSETESS